MGFSGTYIGSASQNQQMISWMKNNGFSAGSKRVPKSGQFWTNENGQEIIVRQSDGAILERLNSGDMVLNNTSRNNLWDFVNNPSEYLRDSMQPNIDAISPISESIQNDIQMEFNLPNVTNYQQFFHEMQNDPKFEKLIQEMTIGQINGHGRLQKYRLS